MMNRYLSMILCLLTSSVALAAELEDRKPFEIATKIVMVNDAHGKKECAKEQMHSLNEELMDEANEVLKSHGFEANIWAEGKYDDERRKLRERDLSKCSDCLTTYSLWFCNYIYNGGCGRRRELKMTAEAMPPQEKLVAVADGLKKKCVSVAHSKIEEFGACGQVLKTVRCEVTFEI